MNHLSEEQIVLHCYGDADDPAVVTQHLRECGDCRQRFEGVQELLRHVEPIEAPEPAALFEEKTWLHIRDRLPRGGFQKWGFQQWIFGPAGRWALAAAAVLLLTAAFLAGRFWPRPPSPDTAKNLANPQRVVLVAVGDHLERSQILLVEVMNGDRDTLADEQKEARDLLDSNYLYQASAQRVGDPRIAHLLDELGPVLTEIANSPSQLSPEELSQIRSRIQSDGLLFKVRVVGSEVNSRLRQQVSGANAQRL
jgi:hypothetical protein